MWQKSESGGSLRVVLSRDKTMWIRVLAAAILFPAALPAFAKQPANDRPNVVFILADDFGYADLHCYGHPYARTPNVDRLASEGTRFTQFYSTGVTCCPARTGLMTGRFPARYQKYPASYGFGDRITVTDLLHRSGYATGHFGKWHIGTESSNGTYGIDVVGGDDGEGTRVRKKSTEQGRDTPIFDAAIKFIEDHRDRPFSMNVWGHITHHPVNPAQKFVDEFAALKVKDSDFSDYQREKFALVRKNGGDVDDSMRRFVADVSSLDQDIGRLLAKLDELGLREKTIVVFSSDQGPAAPRDAGEMPPKKRRNGNPADPEKESLRMNLVGYAGEFRGGKHRDYEGGVRVPFIVRWPGHVPAGRVDKDSVISGADWLPTLCSLTGTAGVPADLDGEDASKAWLGGTHVRSKPLFWKTNTANSDPAIRWQNWKFHGSNRKNGEVELYDLATDPGERKNLVGERPDVVSQLSAKLSDWTKSLPTTYDHGTAKED
jgi:N-acetylgalactosamine-6-sulfatase